MTDWTKDEEVSGTSVAKTKEDRVGDARVKGEAADLGRTWKYGEKGYGADGSERKNPRKWDTERKRLVRIEVTLAPTLHRASFLPSRGPVPGVGHCWSKGYGAAEYTGRQGRSAVRLPLGDKAQNVCELERRRQAPVQGHFSLY